MQLRIERPTTQAEKKIAVTHEAKIVTIKDLDELILPKFQRPLKVNKKVQEVAEGIKASGGIIPSAFTIGLFEGRRYLVDGQHRREAFRISGLSEGYVELRIVSFGSLAEMAEEFKRINDRINPLKPDDMLRAMEASSPRLAKIRRACPYVGYDNIKRGDHTPIISMSSLLRSWAGSAYDTPHVRTNVVQLAEELSDDELGHLLGFMDLAFEAWGRSEEFLRLWNSLNLTLCMWLYRRLVVAPHSNKVRQIDRDQFSSCLHAVSAAGGYVLYLTNRALSQQSTGPTYDRLKGIFLARLEQDDPSRKHYLPSPTWKRMR
jgi:hypothetical protein